MHPQCLDRGCIYTSAIGSSIVSSIGIAVGFGGGIVGIEMYVGKPEEIMTFGMLLLLRSRRGRKAMGLGV